MSMVLNEKDMRDIQELNFLLELRILDGTILSDRQFLCCYQDKGFYYCHLYNLVLQEDEDHYIKVLSSELHNTNIEAIVDTGEVTNFIDMNTYLKTPLCKGENSFFFTGREESATYSLMFVKKVAVPNSLLIHERFYRNYAVREILSIPTVLNFTKEDFHDYKVLYYLDGNYDIENVIVNVCSTNATFSPEKIYNPRINNDLLQRDLRLSVKLSLKSIVDVYLSSSKSILEEEYCEMQDDFDIAESAIHSYIFLKS